MIQNVNSSQIGYSANASYSRSINAAGLSISSTSGRQADSTSFGDTVSLSTFSLEESATYSSVGTITSVADTAYDLLRSYVLDTFSKQGLDTTISINGSTIDLAALSQQDAQSLIAEDGYFGVDQTSDRIVDFAISIAGGDTSRIQAIREGVERGFQEALEAFGGWLPDISYQTYDAVQQKLDDWLSSAEVA